MNLSTLSKKAKENLDRLAGYSRSHRGVSIFCNAQNPFDVPVGFRRMANVFCLWRQPDLNAVSAMASKTGFKPSDFQYLFSHCRKQHDSILIDLTNGTPAKLRFNGYQIIRQNGLAASSQVQELPEKSDEDYINDSSSGDESEGSDDIDLDAL